MQDRLKRRRRFHQCFLLLLIAIFTTFIIGTYHVIVVMKQHDPLNKNAFFIQNENDITNRPLFIFHVGPEKTATTTIQCSLYNYNNQFHNDSYDYIGRWVDNCHPRQNPNNERLVVSFKIFNHLNTNKDMECRRCKLFKKNLDKHRRHNMNIIFSSEEFSYLNFTDRDIVKTLESTLRQWHVKVIMTYRRYHEWIVSNYNQHYKFVKLSKFILWPDQGGKSIPTFEAFLENIINDDNFEFDGMSGTYFRDPFSYLKSSFGKLFPDDVSIFNMHEDSDHIVTNFVCQMIPGAKKACATLEKETPKTINRNPSSRTFHIYIDMLAIAAREKNLTKTKLKRVFVKDAIRKRTKRLQSSFTDFPLKCLSREQERVLLEMSLRVEEKFFPEFFASPQGEAQLRASFETALKEKKFCSVDTDKVLKDEEWREFFNSLEKKK